MRAMKILLVMAVFAVLGAWARYGQTILVQDVMGRDFPWATFSINVLGSFAMGFLFFATLDRLTISPEWRTGLLSGFLGAYTTFSTFALESVHLLEHRQIGYALMYMLGSVFLGVVAAIGGGWLARKL